MIRSSFRSSSGCPTPHRPTLFALPVDHRTTNSFDNMVSSSLVRSRAIDVLFPLPQNVHGSVFHRKCVLPFSPLITNCPFGRMNNCRSQFGWQSAQLKESAISRVVERQVDGPRRTGSAVVGSAVAGSAVTVVGTAAALFSGDGSAAGSSSCAGTDGATSTASRLLFSGLPS